MWQGENNMKMLDGQEVACHLIDPQFLFDILTLWAMTIPTTVPTVDFILASFTFNFVPTQCLGFAISNMLQDCAYTVSGIVFFYEFSGELSDNSADGKGG